MASTNGSAERGYVMNQREMVANFLLLRDSLTSFMTDRRRNIEDECGYPRAGEYDPRLYQLMFDTEAIANRVVTVLPNECSMVQPRIYENESDKITTPFEQGIRDLDIGLQGDDNYCFDEEGSALMEVVARSDVVCGIGRYGIILIGTSGKGDSPDYSKPLEFRPGREASRKLLHLSCYPEALARITERNSDRGSRRYGQPEYYEINFDGAAASQTYSGFGLETASLGVEANNTVHWSRIVHVYDNPISSTVYGVPRQQPVMRRLLDLQKAYAATGEAIWQVGVPGFSVESDPSLGGEVDYDPQALKDSVERYINGFQRWMLANGFVIKTLTPPIADFTPHMSCLLEAICIQLEIPTRVFRGSEIGERASLEDAKRWRVKVSSRRRKHILPRIIRPLFNRLISLGCLPEPGKKGFHAWWPDVETNTPDEQSNIALKAGQALDAYSRGMAREVMPAMDFLVSQMGLSEADARRMVTETERLMEERAKAEAARAKLNGVADAKGSSGTSDQPRSGAANPSGGAGGQDTNAAAVQNFFVS